MFRKLIYDFTALLNLLAGCGQATQITPAPNYWELEISLTLKSPILSPAVFCMRSRMNTDILIIH